MFSLGTENDRTTSIVGIETLERVRELTDQRLIEEIRRRSLDLQRGDEIVSYFDAEIIGLPCVRHVLASLVDSKLSGQPNQTA
jgi:hypothetical protein